jgi:hypothetical protein
MRNYFLITVFLPLCLFSQVTEDFSDGDFTQDPAWTGDLNNFKISFSTAVPAEQRPALQLYATEAGISTLAVAQLFNGELEWQFWVKLSLNTSSGNYARVFLLTNTTDLKAPLNGYFLQIGGVDDSVIFYRQDSTEITRLLCLDSVFTGNSTNALRFKVFRSHEGNWKFYADPAGGHALDFQGETNDLVIPAGDHFGIYCQYSSSNTTKFYFDDFYAGPLIIDSIPPALLKADVINPSEILLIFSEAVDPEIAENIANYDVIPDLGQPYSAIRLLDPDRVQLFFDLEMQNGAAYTLNISSEKDLSGNESGLITQPVWYYLVLPYDLVITEIMADPSPPRELPEYEYLELFNRSSYSLDLGGLSLIISSTIHELPSYTINPGGYLLLCDDDAVEIMMHLCPVAGLSSFTLPNSGTTLQLVDTSGKTIYFLQYDLSWYKEDSKSDGGWSIEMIDPANPCLNEENWKASVHASGGTPGYENSVFANQNSEMKMTKACCLNETELEIEFSESLDSLFASDTGRYSADPFLGHPDLAIPAPPDFRTATLFFKEGFSIDQLYQLTVNPGLKNCIGDEISSSFRSSFALPQPVEPFDIIINEVLFNPLGNGVDYIEIYNRSGKAISLDELILASVKNATTGQPDTQAVSIISSCMVILPSHYILLTSDPQIVKDQYFTSDPEAFLEMASFPSYNNDKGYVLLMDQDKMVIDGMTYSEEMHFLMLNSREGVSLERICPDRFGDDPSNWHSAAETSGFGTPGYKNSQYLEIMEDENALFIQPEVFSPDGDGVDDNLGIVYNFGSPGKLITVLIFNAEGRLAKTLANNEMPGTHGIYSWDGTLDDRTPAQNGIYIIFMEALGMDGKTSHYKKAGVLARNR